MARDFSKNVANYLSLGTGVVAAVVSGSGRISLSCLAFIRSTTAAANDNTIFQIIVGGSSVGVALNIDNLTVAGQRQLRGAGRSQASDARQAINGATNLALNTWIHLGAIIDYTGDKIETYVDGALDGTGAVAFAAATFTPSAATDPDGLGCYSPGLGITTASQFDGLLAELAIWKDDIGADAMRELGNRRVPFKVQRASLRHYWPFDGRGTNPPDFVGGVNAIVTGSIPIADHPRVFR
jgi:hypothetical protein